MFITIFVALLIPQYPYPRPSPSLATFETIIRIVFGTFNRLHLV
jgi:hypothetical protein